MNFHPFDLDAKQWMTAQLENLASKHMQPREMIYYLSSQCHQKKIEIPSYHYFADSITKIYNSIENRLLNTIKNNITEIQSNQLLSLIDENSQSPLISQWKNHNQSTKVKQIRTEMDIFDKIKACFYVILPLLHKLNLTSNSSDYYATWVKKSKLSQR